jgi:hypothetical protein
MHATVIKNKNKIVRKMIFGLKRAEKRWRNFLKYQLRDCKIIKIT